MAIFADVQYYLCWCRVVGWVRKSPHKFWRNIGMVPKELIFAKGPLFTLSLSIHSGSSHNIGQAIWICFDCWKCQKWQFCWLTTEIAGKFKCQNSGQCFGFPPFIIYFVHQVVPAAINSSQLKPNNHDFLKLVFRNCKVENIFVHKLVGFDKAIYVIVSSNSDNFCFLTQKFDQTPKLFRIYSAKMSSFMCKNEIFKA